MYNRYGDISKFIIDMEQLCIAEDGYIYISKEEDYDIAVDMESCYGSLDEVKSFIVFIKHICELDNLVQRFTPKKRIKNGGRGYVPSKPHRTFTVDYGFHSLVRHTVHPANCCLAPDLRIINYDLLFLRIR